MGRILHDRPYGEKSGCLFRKKKTIFHKKFRRRFRKMYVPNSVQIPSILGFVINFFQYNISRWIDLLLFQKIILLICLYISLTMQHFPEALIMSIDLKKVPSGLIPSICSGQKSFNFVDASAYETL